MVKLLGIDLRGKKVLSNSIWKLPRNWIKKYAVVIL